jgi:hypothetical protein
VKDTEWKLATRAQVRSAAISTSSRDFMALP